MKKSIKGFVVGLAVGLAISCAFAGAFTGAINKDLHYNNIKITLNGKAITPADANGNYVEPFIIDGTTYLPVRAVAGALGLDVNWDAETSTVKLGKDFEAPSGEGIVMYDKNGIKISYKELIEYDSYKAYCLLIENNTSDSVHVAGEGVYINGFAMNRSADFGIRVEPGKKAIEPIKIMKHVLLESSITKAETVEFTLRLNNNYDAEEKIVFNP